jgi:endonuclease/exonuclease/phosphatase family metal-dependent hydrolase
MIFKFASWNVNYRRFKDSHFTFLSEVKPDILALQEVSPHFFSEISSSNLFSNYHYSLDYNYIKRGADSSRPRKRGCAVLSSGNIRLRKPLLILDLPYPEKCLILDAELDGTVINVCSFHTPPGVSVKELKPLSHMVLAEWLKSRNRPIILGIDANAPKIDHPDITKNEWYWDDEPKLLGEERIHDLRDAYRDYLTINSARFETIEQSRPKGPLAVSHITGKGHNQTERRYDFIFITPDIRVKSVKYLFEKSCTAGSDHALVKAELEMDI